MSVSPTSAKGHPDRGAAFLPLLLILRAPHSHNRQFRPDFSWYPGFSRPIPAFLAFLWYNQVRLRDDVAVKS